MAELNCRYFNGYKPCGRNDSCNPQCPQRSIPQHRVLIIHLDAMGAVLRSSALIPAVLRKYPEAHITWVTRGRTSALLSNHPNIDRIIKTDTDGLLALSALHFDTALVIDKSLAATGILNNTKVDQVFGFVSDPKTGAIIPASAAANELWEIGLNNHKKFFVNTKPETQLACEALELDYKRDPYSVYLTNEEKVEVQKRREDWLLHSKLLIGINTGCSPILPYKKLTVAKHRELVQKLRPIKDSRIVLLGGPEDQERNEEIAYGTPAIVSPTNKGLRDGLLSVAACDIIVTGDSLGMHMGIALKKWIVAWFGPTCAHEIDLYDRGVKILSDASCGPCWKRSCNKSTMCYDLVELDKIVHGVQRGISWHTSFSKQPLSETLSSPSL